MNFIQLFIPPIYYKVKRRVFPKKQLQSNPLPKVELSGNPMVVIGNGPSLNKSLELYEQQIKESDIIMVNFAAMTDLFFKLRPSVYLLVDPGWFNPAPSQVESCTRCVDTIVSRTHWPMKIVMPRAAQHGYAIAKFKENPNIEVLYYEDGWNMPKDMTQFEAWDKNLVAPPGQTVLNTAIWLSIYWGYKETYLVGADTSFIQDIYVGQKDNILYTIDKHFYKNDDVYDVELEPEKLGRRFNMDMEQLLNAVHTMFSDYKKLRKYADWKGVKVYNASEYSMIDCFERKKFDV